jgi:mannose-1-phosphate guanylyltransferase/mannose-6-phosphate isomerase
MSREQYPKQLLKLGSTDTLLQSTVKRIASWHPHDRNIVVRRPLVISNEAQRFLVAEQIVEAGVAEPRILLEPVARNTAPALSLAAFDVLANGGDALLLVMPADHVIRDQAAFHMAVENAAKLAQQDYIVTFGIVPTAPETGYGYIKRAAKIASFNGEAAGIDCFVEKPNLATAKQYLASGDYLWNSGMFLVKASVWQQALQRFRADIFHAVSAAYDKRKDNFDFVRVDTQAFTLCPSDSIDYAVMEKLGASEKGAVLPLDAGWSDVGAWDSLWDITAKNNDGNVLEGDTLARNTKNSMVMASHRMVATLGVKDLIVVETADAVLIADKSSAQQVKEIVAKLKADGRDEVLFHRRVPRPWGSYEGIDAGQRFQVKRIVVKPGASLSLQMHYHRAEHWIVVQGTARVTRGEEVILLSENQSTYIPLGVKHRLENPGTIPLEMIEVQSGSYLGEDDIVRFDDVYGRQ